MPAFLNTLRGRCLTVAAVGVVICIGLFAFGEWSAALELLVVCVGALVVGLRTDH